MNKRFIASITAILSLLVIVSIAAADGSYPIPNLYPIGQSASPTYPYTYPYQQNYTQPTPQPYNYYQQPYNYPPTNCPQPYNCPPSQQPYYDPYSGQYVYPYGQNPDPYNPYNQWNNQPVNRPKQPSNNVQVSVQQSYNNTLNLTWTIRNISNEDWPMKNFDIKCVGGSQLLSNPSRTLWDIPYTVRRGGQLSFTVNIRQPWPGDYLTFAIVAGSKTVYTFSVYPY